jgi:DNA-binding NarL/FixJ family response regulator
VDDHALFREGLARLLGSEPDLEVTARCGSVSEGLEVLASNSVNLVLLDVDLGNERGLDFLQRARRQSFSGPILVVTAGISERAATQLIAQGAAGVFLKQDSAQLLAEGIRTVAQGRAWIDQRYLTSLAGARSIPSAEHGGSLTEREREVLRGVFNGHVNKEIAASLGISESSVKAILQQLFHKTGVRTRSQLVRVALEQNSGDL